ncbi:MAG: hypothetical protein ACFB15_04020 [Cyclobacteriaceae bacterium]
MTQSLLHWVSSPVGWLALLLWISLAILAFRQCRTWAKREKVIQQNHSSIPEVNYTTSDGNKDPVVVEHSARQSPLTQATASSSNVWDVS